jgi:hypothetical protein
MSVLNEPGERSDGPKVLHVAVGGGLTGLAKLCPDWQRNDRRVLANSPLRHDKAAFVK